MLTLPEIEPNYSFELWFKIHVLFLIDSFQYFLFNELWFLLRSSLVKLGTNCFILIHSASIWEWLHRFNRNICLISHIIIIFLLFSENGLNQWCIMRNWLCWWLSGLNHTFSGSLREISNDTIRANLTRKLWITFLSFNTDLEILKLLLLLEELGTKKAFALISQILARLWVIGF